KKRKPGDCRALRRSFRSHRRPAGQPFQSQKASRSARRKLSLEAGRAQRRNYARMTMIYEVTIESKTHRVELVRQGSGWSCKLEGRVFPLEGVRRQGGVLWVLVEGRSYEVCQEPAGAETSIVVGNERFNVTVRDPRSLRSRRGAGDSSQGLKKIVAPMPGKIVRIVAPAGTEVEAGQPVVVIEAMKMQNELKSPKKGKVKKINVSEGAAVEAGQTLAEVE